MTHLRIELNNIPENISSDVIHKLYETAKTIIDTEEANDVQESLISLKGNLLVSKAYGDEVDWLEAKFPNLHITVTVGKYIKFADDAVYARLSLYLGDGTGIISSEITNANIFSSSNDSSTGYPYFRGNTSITSFNELGLLPLVTTIPGSAFRDTSNLTSIDLSNITSVGDSSFLSSGITSADLSSCTTINNSAFRLCTDLMTVILSPSISTISNWAFSGCTSLTSIDLSNVINVLNYAFENCTLLTSIDLSSCTSIGKYAFTGCSSLVSADLSNVTSIETEVFWNCSLLSSVTLPQGTSYIPNGMFYMCSNLSTITGIDFNNISHPGHCCFRGCSSLQLPSTISISGNMVGSYAFAYHSEINKIVLSLSSSVMLYNSAFEGCTGLTLIENHNSIVGVGWGSFQNCYALAGTLDLSNLNGYCSNIRVYNAEQGGSGSLFKNCRALTKIIIGYLPNLSSSPYGASGTFCNCYSLTEIDIARLDSITLNDNINLGPCLGCSALLRIILRCTQVPTINLSHLSRESDVITCLTGSTGVLIYVPDSVLNDYKSETGWSLIANYIHPLSEIENV